VYRPRSTFAFAAWNVDIERGRYTRIFVSFPIIRNAPTSPVLDSNHPFQHPRAVETLTRTGLDATWP